MVSRCESSQAEGRRNRRQFKHAEPDKEGGQVGRRGAGRVGLKAHEIEKKKSHLGVH